MIPRLFGLCLGLWLPLAAVAQTNVPAATPASAPARVAGQTVLTFGLNRVPALQHEVLGNPLWQYLASVLYVLLAFYFSKLLDYLLQVQLRKWAARTQTRVDDLLLELLRGPVRVISFVVLLHLGLRVFAWPVWASEFISNALKIIVACSITYVALKVVDLLMGVWQQRAESREGGVDMQLFPILRKTLKLFVAIVAILVTSQNLGMNVTGLLASLSIGGLAVGLAAQDTLSNLFGAVAIFADKPFRVGDRIQIDTIEGVVETIGLRSTRLRSLDGYLVTVPNRTMANANIINVSKRPTIKTILDIGLTYNTTTAQLERAMAVIAEVYRAHPRTADLVIHFNKFDSSSLNIQVVHWWNSNDLKDYLAGFHKLNLELKRRFDEEKLEFAFPTRTLYVRQDSQWQLAGAAAQPQG